MKKIITVGQNRYTHDYNPGPQARGFVSVHAEIPPEYLAVMKATNIECGGCLSVNEQIRRAIRAYITGGLVYTSLVKR
jgi:hypothetical protein